MEEINTNDNTAKVVCRSRQAISKECEHLYTALNNVLNKSAERSSYDKSRYFQRFKECYEKICDENIIVDHVSQVDGNTTPEYESKDREKESLINDQLLPQLNDCLVNLAKKRRNGPKSCIKAARNTANHHAIFLSKVKPQATPVDREAVCGEIQRASCLLDDQSMALTCCTFGNLIKKAERDGDRASHLQEAAHMKVSSTTKCHGWKFGPLPSSNSVYLSGKPVSDAFSKTASTSNQPVQSQLMATMAKDFVAEDCVGD